MKTIADLSTTTRSRLRTLHTIHALLLGGMALLGAVAGLRALPDMTSPSGAPFFFGGLFNVLFIAAALVAFAVFELRWARRLNDGASPTRGLLLGGIMIFGSTYFTIGLAFMGALRIAADLPIYETLQSSFIFVYPGLIFLAQLLGLYTLLSLIRALPGRARAASLLGAFGATLALQSLLAMVRTAPALFGPGLALSVGTELAYSGPPLGRFAANAAFAPYGVNGSGGELWPIFLTVALVLPISLLLLRQTRILLRGVEMRPSVGIGLGLLVFVAGLSPFGSDRLSLDPFSLLSAADLAVVTLGLALIAFSLRMRLLCNLTVLLGLFAVGLHLWDLLLGGYLDDEIVVRLINGFALIFAPERIAGTASVLLSCGFLVALLFAAGREQTGTERS